MANNRQNRKNISNFNSGFSFLPQITHRTSEQFLQDIIKIQENQYTPINHVPTLFGRRINLLSMYNAVAQRGGLKKMVTEISWQGVMKELKIPLTCANACVALRSIYQRYLEQFERLQRNKATISDIEEELQIDSENRYKNITQKSTLTHVNISLNNMVYRSDLHQISSHKRQEMGLSCDLSDVYEYRNLEMSLKSGLVNEIEFSLNTCLLMSYQNEGIQLWRNPKILDLILSSVSISDSDLPHQTSADPSSLKFLTFWNNTVVNENGRKFLHRDVFLKDKVSVSNVDSLNQIFVVNEELNIYDKEGQRIQLVATIIRNLAFDKSNGRFLTQSHQCIRFILLCCYASHLALHHLGLEIVSMIKFPIRGILSETFIHLLVNLTQSEDRIDRLRGLEITSSLCDPTICAENIDFLFCLPKTFYTSLIATLIVHDLHILVLALEVIYGLSEVDPVICRKLIECSSETLITLYTLLNLEAQVLGTQSLIRIRVMQGPSTVTSLVNNVPHTNNRLNSSTLHQNQCQLATSLMPPPPVPLHKVPISVMPVSNVTSIKIQSAADSTSFLKSISNQKNNSLITKSNSVHQLSLCTVSAPPISEMTTISSTISQLNESILTNPPSKTFLQPQLNLNVQYSLLSQKFMTTNISNFVSSTSLAPAKPAVSNYTPVIKTTCISTPLPTFSLESTNKDETNDKKINNLETSIISQTTSKLSSTSVIASNASNKNNTKHIDLSIKENEKTPSSVTKEEFVKNWLLNNYIEFPQSTVPLFVIYKQLQIAVQSHFKDSEMVTAEEFHKLVRLLFPQVQLIQLFTPRGTVEIHYYNLKSNPKSMTLESLLESSKLKPILNNSQENNICKIKNNVPHINNAQSNHLSEPVNDHKNLKRQSNEIVNGFQSEQSESSHVLSKKIRLNDDIDQYSSQKSSTSIGEFKENHLKNTKVNGIVPPPSVQNDLRNHIQSDHTVKKSYISNGFIVEDVKCSDSETKIVPSAVFQKITKSSTTVTNVNAGNLIESNQQKRLNINSNVVQVTIKNEPGFSVFNDCVAENVKDSLPDDVSNSDSSVQRKPYRKMNSNQLGRTRSRFRNSRSGNNEKQRNYSNHRPHNLSHLYICEWDNCLQSFDKPQKVYGHVYTNHFMTLRTEVQSICLWAGCEDKTHRTPLPLLNHVNEQHCNNVALEAARQLRLANEKEKEIVSTSENALPTTDVISPPKLINISTNNFSTKISSSVAESSKSSLSCQLVTQSQASHLSTNHILKPVTVTSSQQLSMFHDVNKQSKLPLTSESNSTIPKVIASASDSISTPIATVSLTSQSEVSVSPSGHSSISQIKESITVSQILSKLKSQSSVTLSSSLPSNIPSTSCELVKTVESIQSAKPQVKEGPVTKHIRVLSALILRNLCKNSNTARRFVSARHQQIFELAISGCESSLALSECLLYSSNETGES